MAQGRDRASDSRRELLTLGATGREQDLNAARPIPRHPAFATEAPIEQETCDSQVLQHGVGDMALVDARRDDGPGADQPLPQIGAQCQAEPVEPLVVGGVMRPRGCGLVRVRSLALPCGLLTPKMAVGGQP